MCKGAWLSEAVTQSKSALRARLKGVAAGVSAADVLRWSSQVIDRLESVPEIAGARTMLAFLPIPGEVDLSEMLERRLRAGDRVALPAIDWATRAMWPGLVSGLDDVDATRHGVRAARGDAPIVPVEDIDLVLVPGLGFDRNGGRLGRGAGFYDRFLATAGLRALKIAVGFEWQIVDALPREGHDVLMDVVVTEAGVWRR